MARNFKQGQEKRSQEYKAGKRALPEPQLVKRKILAMQEEVRHKKYEAMNYQSPSAEQDFKQAVLNFYDTIRVYLQGLSPEKVDKYNNLDELEVTAINNGKSFEDFVNYAYKLDDLLYDLGVTDIGVSQKSYNYGLEIFNGAIIEPHVTKKIRRWMNWHRLKANFTAMKYHLKGKDMDGFILAWGANRAGKSTLAIHLMDLVNSGEITEKNFVNTDEGFYNATENLKPGQAYLIDELSNIFDIHDTRKSEQNKRVKKLETYAERNLLGFGCTVDFFRVDKSIYSKLGGAIKITSRGDLNFYSQEDIEDFDRDRQMRVVKTPEPEFRAKFPKRDDKVWETYRKAVEDDKIFKKKKEEKRRDEDDKPSKRELIVDDLENTEEEIDKEKIKELRRKYDTSIQYIKNIKSEIS